MSPRRPHIWYASDQCSVLVLYGCVSTHVCCCMSTSQDYSDLMGNRDNWNKLNAMKMIFKGYLASSRVRKVDSTTANGMP